jgi:hypothetical protein
LNRVTKGLKEILCSTVEYEKEADEKPAESGKEASKKTAEDDKEGSKKRKWRTLGNFTCEGEDAEFGAGCLSLSVGTLNPGHWVCTVYLSFIVRKPYLSPN